MNSEGLRRIISGAQTGVDRAALDSAIMMPAFSWGGCVPRGRMAEDGQIHPNYFETKRDDSGLWEHSESRDYKTRTLANIQASDATMILRIHDPGKVLGPGTKLTLRTLRKLDKPYAIFDPSRVSTVPKAVQWVCETLVPEGIHTRNINVLNVAGSRESSCPGIYEHARSYMRDVLNYVFVYQVWGSKIWGPRTPKGKTQ